MSKKALGRGLEALIPKKPLEERKGQAQQIPVSKIKPNPFQPRKIFRTEDLQELVHSIKEKGIIQPIVVRKKGDQWEIIAGERRYRAAQKLGMLTMPATEVVVARPRHIQSARRWRLTSRATPCRCRLRSGS